MKAPQISEMAIKMHATKGWPVRLSFITPQQQQCLQIEVRMCALAAKRALRAVPS